MPARKYYQRGVSKTKLEVPMAPRKPARHPKLFTGQAFDKESTIRQIVQEGKLDVDT